MRGARRLGMHRCLAPIVLVALLTLGVTPVASQDGPDLVGRVDAFEAVGEGAAEWLVPWSVTRADAQWHITAQEPKGSVIRLGLLDQDGAPIDDTHGRGTAELFDVSLHPGPYLLRVSATGSAATFSLRAEAQAEAFDAEPNGASGSPVDLAEGAAIRGRLARTSGDSDRYRLAIPPGDPSLRDVRLSWTGGPGRQLCLLGPDGQDLACRSRTGTATLRDLLLAAGEHYVEVRGKTDPGATYELSLQATGDPRPGHEFEPNDTPETATPLDLAMGMQGHSDLDDLDHFRFDVQGEPQLWRVDATGEGVASLAWLRPDGTELARMTATIRGSASLADLLLPPGPHMFAVRSRGGDYHLQATPQGAREPDGEREPNDDITTAESYAIGQRRVGRLPTTGDRDLYRFTLTAPQHVRLRLRHPPEGLFEVRLESGGSDLVRQWPSETGQDLRLDLWLEPGDHILSLGARQPDEGDYELTTERLDPFLLAADLEPNGSVLLARPVPSSLSWSGGAAGGDRDDDWFVLPPLVAPSDVALRVEEGRLRVKLHAGPGRLSAITLQEADDGWLVASEVPADRPVYLQVQAAGPYALRVESPAWQPQPDPVAPEVDMDLQLDVDEVAAYWPGAQLIRGRLRLANEGSTALDLGLEVHTSHMGWYVEIPEEALVLPAAATTEIPIEVTVPPDAWLGQPVWISLAARTADGGLRTAAARVVPALDARVVPGGPGWTVPEPLLGGLDAASLALGGAPRGDIDAASEALLFDGLAPSDGGFRERYAELPVELVVDLAGEDPVPVAGTIIDPRAGTLAPREMPRRFELLLSSDGEHWEPALDAEMVGLWLEQAFVLEEPVMATHAMLRVHSLQGDGNHLAMGEWKVITQPGTSIEPTGFDIASPLLGGHVVRLTPFPGGAVSDFQTGILDPEAGSRTVSVDPDDRRFEAVLGFQDGRAAQITELGWQDAAESDPATRLESLKVQVSTDSPLGPWQDLGLWSLERADDGSVAALVFGQPVWARYLRLASELPETLQSLELPGAVRVIERATAAGYRSILGEWGAGYSMGPLEWSSPSSESDGPAVETDAGSGPDEATPLVPALGTTGRVEAGVDQDWYSVAVPAYHDLLQIDVQALSGSEVRLSLLDSAGEARRLSRTTLAGGILRYEARVEPGQTYRVGVDQPPYSLVVAFDPRRQLGWYPEQFLRGMRDFVAEVRPGREAVMLMPFGQPPLLDDWADDPRSLTGALEAYASPAAGSDDVEGALMAASALLEQREGRRAILLMTDAQIGDLDRAPDLWQALEAARPAVYGVHVEGSRRPLGSRHLMQSWSAAAAGLYTYAADRSAVDRAIELMATRLRRPAIYALTATSLPASQEPGRLTVDVMDGQPGLVPGTAVAVILDTSQVMRTKLEGEPRLATAREALKGLLREALPEGTPVSLRVFGGRGGGKAARCKTQLAIPPGALEPERALEILDGVVAGKRTRAPIAAALEATADEAAGREGSTVVLLVTAGGETCSGDLAAAAETLRALGSSLRMEVIGLALDEVLKVETLAWTEAGGGTYLDAPGAEGLAAALGDAIRTPFRVLDEDGQVVARGRVGGEPVSLAPGAYRVEVLTEPPIVFDPVAVLGGGSLSLTLPEADAGG